MSSTKNTALIVGSIEAAILGSFVAYTTSAPLVVAFVFFILFRPGAALAADAVANHYNPADASVGPPSMKVIAAGLLVLPTIAAVVAATLMWWRKDPFLPTYSYCLMGCAAVGAVNGIIMEWEDNQPGGWLNPKEKD